MSAVSENLHADKDGHYRRKAGTFRDFISKDPTSNFPAQKDRYALIGTYGCPWVHRTLITRRLKGLENVIELILTDFDISPRGYLFTGRNGSMFSDPLYGFSSVADFYHKANPDYKGRFTVPVLWDKKMETIVNNESGDIMRMLYSEWEDLVPQPLQEVNDQGGGLLPDKTRDQIDEMNEWVYNTINNGVYKCGFASTEEAYEANLHPLFESLDRLENLLGTPGHSPYLFGAFITEADIRLYTTLIRFDVAYGPIFQVNRKTIRDDYPQLSRWLRNLYWDESEKTNHGAFHDTVRFDIYNYAYEKARRESLEGNVIGDRKIIVAEKPRPDIYPLTDAEKRELEDEIRELVKL